MCMENNNTVMKLQQTFRSEAHNIVKKNVSKIILSVRDGKGLQNRHEVTSYPYDTGVARIFKTRLLTKL